MLELNMITVYEVKANGFLGRTKQINPAEGVGYGWVYDVPPTEICKWENNTWVSYSQESVSVSFGVDDATLAETYKKQRNELLSASDFTQLPDVPFSDELRQAWVVYRQALRDLTEQEGFPLTCVFPDQPA
jgi:hypothetical protein